VVFFIDYGKILIMIELFFVFIFGLIIGSFLNCVIWRTYKEESFLLGKSYCPNCKHNLSFWDLFPLFSFIFLKGKCRYCGKKISYQYPLVELITGIVFSFVFLQVGLTAELIFLWIIMALFIAIFVFDLKHYIIPDGFVFSGILVSIIWIVYSGGGIDYLISATCSALFFFIIWLFSKGMAMGFGDVKLAFLLGLILGYPNIIVGVFLGFLFGAIIGLIMVIFQKRQIKSEVPFAPFLLAGSFIAIFWGSNIINWYTSLIK
jgi:leader peptidase (prepilin peptidase)/N-methyltransferase